MVNIIFCLLELRCIKLHVYAIPVLASNFVSIKYFVTYDLILLQILQLTSKKMLKLLQKIINNSNEIRCLLTLYSRGRVWCIYVIKTVSITNFTYITNTILSGFVNIVVKKCKTFIALRIAMLIWKIYKQSMLEKK